MKTILLLCLFFFTTGAFANDLGVGISLGNPTGLNGKYWLDKDHAVDGGMGFSLGKHSDLSLHSDYLFHKQGAFFFNDVHPLDLYYGLGGRMEFSDDINLGVRVPVGLAHRVEDNSADMFAEIAPIVNVLSSPGINLQVLFGARYYL